MGWGDLLRKPREVVLLFSLVFRVVGLVWAVEGLGGLLVG